ncbi:MAG: TetR/AcrR family transcriptional regulator [Bacillota bacterium]
MDHNEQNPEKVDKKERIIKAGLEIFSSKLFHQVSMYEVAVASGVGKGTIYLYFDSKESLFTEVIKYSYGFYYEALKECLETGYSAYEKLKKVMTMQKEFMQTQKRFIYLLAEEKLIGSLLLEDEAFQCQQDIIELVRGVIDEGIEAGEFKKMDSTLAAKVFMGGIASLWYDAYVYENKKAMQQNSVDEIMNIICHGYCEPGVISG